MRDLFSRPLMAIDVEGDGNTPIEPIEVSAIEFSDAAVSPARTWLCNPGRPISPYASAIHGLRDADVAGLPPFEAHAQQILDTLKETTIVGHGVRGDMHTLVRKIPELKGTSCLDTLKLAKVAFPDFPSYRLQDLIDELGLVIEAPAGSRGPHSAGFDAEAARRLFVHILDNPSPTILRHLRDAGFTLADSNLKAEVPRV